MPSTKSHTGPLAFRLNTTTVGFDKNLYVRTYRTLDVPTFANSHTSTGTDRGDRRTNDFDATHDVSKLHGAPAVDEDQLRS
jgi:hypothetical protein